MFTGLCHQLNGYNNFNYKKSYCGNGIQVLNIDLKGNLYQCHNNWIQIGSIYDDYLKYLNNANELNYMAEQNLLIIIVLIVQFYLYAVADVLLFLPI